MNGHGAICSCGNPSDHVVMRRRTFDGIDVYLWDDGAVTGALGYGLRGVPVRRPTGAAIRRALVAGRLLLGELCIWRAAELGDLYAAARRAADIDGLPGTMRRIMRERRAKADAPATPLLSWAVVATDRDGKPTERVARLPRIRWPGLAVWDFCGGPGSSRGRYVLMSRIAGAGTGDETYKDTGLAFSRLDRMWAHLRAN